MEHLHLLTLTADKAVAVSICVVIRHFNVVLMGVIDNGGDSDSKRLFCRLPRDGWKLQLHIDRLHDWVHTSKVLMIIVHDSIFSASVSSSSMPTDNWITRSIISTLLTFGFMVFLKL